MPEISRFFGIIIRMFMEAGAQHHTPHFHAHYQEHVGVFSIDPVELIAGDLPRTQRSWSRHGRNSTARSSTRIGSGYRPVDRLSPSRRYNRGMNAHLLYRVTSFERVGTTPCELSSTTDHSRRSSSARYLPASYTAR